MQGSGPALLDYDPFSVAAMTDPYPLYREPRATRPVFPLPRYDAFALSRFQDVWGVIEDGARFSIAEGPVFFPEVVGRPGAASGLEPWHPARTFSSWDPPVHTGLRQALHAHFRRGAVAGLEATARRIAGERLAGDEPLVAPDLVVAEVTNAAWKLARAGEISDEHGARIAAAIPAAFSALVGAARLSARAFALAHELDHPVYDCLYLALAEIQDVRAT